MWLYAENAAQAMSVYNDVMNIPNFASCEEGAAANELITAYREGSEEEVKGTIKRRSCFQFLDTAAARLAMKLPKGDLEKMSEQLGGAEGVREGGGEAENELELKDDDLT